MESNSTKEARKEEAIKSLESSRKKRSKLELILLLVGIVFLILSIILLFTPLKEFSLYTFGMAALNFLGPAYVQDI